MLNALFRTWFANQPTESVAELLEESSVLAQRYRTFDEVVASGALAANPLFTDLDQPGVGTYLAAGLPAGFDGEHFAAGPAPTLGADTPTWPPTTQ